MRKWLMLAVSLLVLAAAGPACAQVEALGLTGVGSYWDADNNVTVGAFGGAQVYLSQSPVLNVLTKTFYLWGNEDGSDDQVQAIETYTCIKKYLHKGWFVSLGGGAAFAINDDEDQTNLGALLEGGYTQAGFDLFLGVKVNSLTDGKHKMLYAGVSLQ